MLRNRERNREEHGFKHEVRRARSWSQIFSDNEGWYMCGCVYTPSRIYFLSSRHGLVTVDPRIVENEGDLRKIVEKMTREDIERITRVIEKCGRFNFVDEPLVREAVEKLLSILPKK